MDSSLGGLQQHSPQQVWQPGQQQLWGRDGAALTARVQVGARAWFGTCQGLLRPLRSCPPLRFEALGSSVVLRAYVRCLGMFHLRTYMHERTHTRTLAHTRIHPQTHMHIHMHTHTSFYPPRAYPHPHPRTQQGLGARLAAQQGQQQDALEGVDWQWAGFGAVSAWRTLPAGCAGEERQHA